MVTDLEYVMFQPPKGQMFQPQWLDYQLVSWSAKQPVWTTKLSEILLRSVVDLYAQLAFLRCVENVTTVKTTSNKLVDPN